MKIDPKILSEKNYEGSRFIEIEKDEILTPLFDEFAVFKKEMTPLIDESDPLYAKTDPVNVEINKLTADIRQKTAEYENKKNALKATVQDELDRLEVIAEKQLKIEARSQIVKNKLMPIIFDRVKDQLSEFEVAFQIKEKDGKIFVEVQDKLEELIKSIRAQKAKK